MINFLITGNVTKKKEWEINVLGPLAAVDGFPIYE